MIPATWYSQLSKGELSTIKTWVEAGGTLVAIDGSAVPFTSKEAGLSRVRQIKDTLKEVEQYDISLQREWLAQQNSYAEIENIWSHDAATDINYPWKSGPQPKGEKELKKQYNWLAKFRPSGAIVAARTDQKHWLTFGSPEVIPVLISRNPVLLSLIHISEPTRQAEISYAVFCLKKKK